VGNAFDDQLRLGECGDNGEEAEYPQEAEKAHIALYAHWEAPVPPHPKNHGFGWDVTKRVVPSAHLAGVPESKWA